MNKELLPPCRYCKYMERREQIKCDENCNSLNEFNDYVRTTIAARDKWFIKTIEDRFGDGHDKPLIQIGVQDWQDFKASLEVK